MAAKHSKYLFCLALLTRARYFSGPNTSLSSNALFMSAPIIFSASIRVRPVSDTLILFQ